MHGETLKILLVEAALIHADMTDRNTWRS